MAPHLALDFPIPDAPRDLVRLVVPPAPDDIKRLLYLADDLPAAGLIEVLHRERRRLVERRVDEDRAVPVADRRGGVDVRQRDVAGERRLCLQCLSEVEREGRAAVDARQRGLHHRPADRRREGLLVRWVLVQREDGPDHGVGPAVAASGYALHTRMSVA